MSGMEVIVYIIALVLLVNVVFAAMVVFFERRNPVCTWAWLLVLFFIPVFGFLLYLVFGQDGKKEKMFAEKERHDYEIYYRYLFQGVEYRNMLDRQKRKMKLQEEGYQDLAYLNLSSGSWITEDNVVERFVSGLDKFEALINDIRHAKKFIHMEYYIIRNDVLGKNILRELEKKAAEGVEVKLLYDGMGCFTTSPMLFQALKDAGGCVAAFLPPFFVRLNYRNHRKLCIIDGNIGYIGGFNIGDEYLGNKKRYGPWRDTHLRITGSAVGGMELRFIMDWNFTDGVHALPLLDRYFPKESDRDGVKIQILSSGPDTKNKNIFNGYFKMITGARDHVYIETPYFVPDDSIFSALKIAALSGVDVRIIIPANPDHLFVYGASISYLGELLDAGVRCYQYKSGFIHAKVLCADGVVASVGSANMDVRSFGVNFEINAFLYDKGITALLEEDFLQDLAFCQEITKDWYIRRPLWFRWKEAVSRLISPIL